jgi:hypothetical protein
MCVISLGYGHVCESATIVRDRRMYAWTFQPEHLSITTIAISLGFIAMLQLLLSYLPLFSLLSNLLDSKTNLRGLTPRANYTDRATAAC